MTITINSSNDSHIEFWLNGKTVSVNNVQPHTSLLQWLRSDPQTCGTKEGCAEGDCGACTVLLVLEPTGDNGALQTKPINSCIRLLPTLHGKAVVTVEGLSDINTRLHPVQEAMVTCHGSQCGFCTPGFVMSLAGLYKQKTSASRAEVCVAIAGNLCRCTGYQPILNAAQEMLALGKNNTKEASIKPAWQQWLAQVGPALEHDGAKQIQSALANIAKANAVYTYDGYSFFSPTSIDEVSKLLAAYPNGWILAGGTDVGLWINKALQLNRQIIWLGAVDALQTIETSPTGLTIGAGVATAQAFAAMNKIYPQFASIWERFASVPVRNSATLCGNIANGSPIGDSMPVLIALGAAVQLSGGNSGSRKIALEDLYVDYKKQSRATGEWVQSVHVPHPKADQLVAAYKLSKRPEQDISAVLFAINITKINHVITSARIAYGGMAGTPKRARAAEAALLNKTFDQATFEAAALAVAHDFSPLSDMRASQTYRASVAANCLRRFHLEQTAAPETVRLI